MSTQKFAKADPHLRFLIDKDDPLVMSIMKKLSNTRSGQIIPLTPKEFKAFQGVIMLTSNGIHQLGKT